MGFSTEDFELDHLPAPKQQWSANFTAHADGDCRKRILAEGSGFGSLPERGPTYVNWCKLHVHEPFCLRLAICVDNCSG